MQYRYTGCVTSHTHTHTQVDTYLDVAVVSHVMEMLPSVAL